MKAVGLVFIAIGFGLIVMVIINYMNDRNKYVSPIPEDKGVKVIFITPPTK